MDQRPPAGEFGKRRPAPSTAPVKRSGHVALLLMGTLAVGGGAYALLPRERCAPSSAGVAAPASSESLPECGRGGSRNGGGSGGGGGATHFSSSGDASGRSASAGTSESSSSGVTRGGFGSFARAFGLSGGG